MSALSVSSPSAAGASLTSTQASTDLKRCLYCPREFLSGLERCQHVVDNPKCKAARDAAVIRAARKQMAERRQRTTTEDGRAAQPNVPNTAGPHASTSKRKAAPESPPNESDMPASSGIPGLSSSGKRRKVATPDGEDVPASSMSSASRKWPKVTVETAPDQDDTPASTEHPTRPVPNTPTPPTNDTSPNPGAEPQPGPSSQTRTAPIDRDRTARPRLRRYKGFFVEDFPDPLAGSPISKDHAPPPDLDAHMRSCGTLANPFNFEVAELLSTTGLTDEAKDQHLKSSIVSNAWQTQG
ncbi:hypothetical protein FS749_008309 [Ceratobasidium sp. UAMH 11750]|nr:hypothetical protein FS749_008309 [Ceratobasidium sp. UAMH 11750]